MYDLSEVGLDDGTDRASEHESEIFGRLSNAQLANLWKRESSACGFVDSGFDGAGTPGALSQQTKYARALTPSAAVDSPVISTFVGALHFLESQSIFDETFPSPLLVGRSAATTSAAFDRFIVRHQFIVLKALI